VNDAAIVKMRDGTDNLVDEARGVALGIRLQLHDLVKKLTALDPSLCEFAYVEPKTEEEHTRYVRCESVSVEGERTEEKPAERKTWRGTCKRTHRTSKEQADKQRHNAHVCVQLHDNVVVLVGLVHLGEANDVGVFARREDVNLCLQHLKALGTSVLLGDDFGGPFLA
jgi:hypothetical protein